MKSRVFAVAVALLGMVSGGASAADMPPAYKAAPAAQFAPYDWTGFYVGLHAGGAWNDNTTTVNFLPDPVTFLALPFAFTPNGEGWLGGAQIGANWQSGVWVLGVEADISYVDLDSAGTVAPILTPGGVPLPGTVHTSNSEMSWFGTVRLRGGIAWDRFLLYVTGGLAVANIDHATATAGPGIIYAATASDTATGWTLGGGFEWAFAPNWSVKLEYLYYDLGNTTLVANPVPANPPFQVATTFEDQGHIARIGVNYRFGPIAASPRY
jgi:outer membrane immunogenic protein